MSTSSAGAASETLRETHRDAGLVRAMGPWALAAAVVNGVVGGGIFSMPAALGAAAGSLAPIAILLCAVAMAGVVLCFAEATARAPSSGGAYAAVDAAFGPLPAFLTGLMLWVSSVLACGGIADAMASGLAHYAPSGQSLLRAVLILAVVGGIAYLNIRGVAPAARAIGLMTVIKLVPLAILVVVGGGWLLAYGSSAPLPAAPTGGFGSAILLALFAFSGLETPMGASGEVRDPERTIPRALFIGMGAVLLLYIAIQWVCQGLLGPDLPTSDAPLSDAMARISPWLGAFLLLGASVSRLAWIGSDVLGAPRFLHAFARDGTMPAVLGLVHPVSHAPWVAILVHAGIAILLALTGTFETLAILSALVTAPIYILACLAAIVLRRRNFAAQGSPPHIPLLWPAAGLGILGMIAAILLAQPRDVGGLVLLLAAGTLWYFAAAALKKRKSRS